MPTIYSLKYWKIIWGSLKIGRQFYSAHHHHSPKEIAIARYKGEVVKDLNFKNKLSHPSFFNLVNNMENKEIKSEKIACN